MCEKCVRDAACSVGELLRGLADRLVLVSDDLLLRMIDLLVAR